MTTSVLANGNSVVTLWRIHVAFDATSICDRQTVITRRGCTRTGRRFVAEFDSLNQQRCTVFGAGRAVGFWPYWVGGRVGPGERGASIDDLLDRAVEAINRGDRATATALAGQVLAVDRDNADAEDLRSAPGNAGEIRRLTILFADLVDSTALSTRVEPETYRTLVGRYRQLVISIVNRFEGHVGSTKVMGCWRCSVIPLPTRMTCVVRCWRGWRSPGKWPG